MIGSQLPRIRIEPPRETSDGPDAAMLMRAYANALDPWQEAVVDCWLGRDARGRYTVSEAGLTLPRQNGKNVCIEARELFGLVINADHILHTAHQVVTAKKSFNRLARIFDDPRHPEMQALIKNIRRTNGEESIELTNGGIVEFSARSREKARGFADVSLVIYDEAQELTDDQIEAIMPILAASTRDRQSIYAGTPPYPSCPGTVFRRFREACRKDPGKRDAWHEWSVEADSIDQIDTSDVSLWYDTNPALGIRLTEDQTRNEHSKMSPDGFARERLNWWIPELSNRTVYAIPESVWDAAASDDPKPDGKTAYGVKFSADGTEVALCGAVIPAEGAARISLIAYRPTSDGLSWLADWLNERYAKASAVAIDGRNGVAVLRELIGRTWQHPKSVIYPRASDVVAAASMLMDGLNTHTLTWFREQLNLRESAVSSTRRPISGGWGFGGDMSAPIEAAALAFWAAKTARRDPTRKMRIG